MKEVLSVFTFGIGALCFVVYAESRTMPRQCWRGAIGADLRATG
jgi:hypothetical protein